MELNSKRRFLLVANGVAGSAAAAAVAYPFAWSMKPSAKARAAGAPVEVDIDKIELGMMITVEWRGKPVWIVHRTQEMIDSLPKIEQSNGGSPIEIATCSQPMRAITDVRSRTSTWSWSAYVPIWAVLRRQKLVAGTDSGLGGDWPGGFYCPAMARNSIWRAAFSKGCRRPPISRFRRIPT